MNQQQGRPDPDVSQTLGRLEDQIGWYDRKSRAAQRWFKCLNLAKIFTAGLIPLVDVVKLSDPGKATAVMGLAIVFLEGVQQLNQYQQNWIG